MAVRTYRVLVTGQFDKPEPTIRERLLAEQAEHDVLESAFSTEGTFTYPVVDSVHVPIPPRGG
jgi:hypothetical protein